MGNRLLTVAICSRLDFAMLFCGNALLLVRQYDPIFN